MIEYFTSFNLVYPVIDYDAAVKYLTEDDMTQYTPKSLCKDILSIKWNLYDEQRGEVTLRTTREFSPEELDIMSSWVRGQNSDGLGEGFEQQSFADYNICSKDYERDEDEDEECWVMASFDWETNPYHFTRRWV